MGPSDRFRCLPVGGIVLWRISVAIARPEPEPEGGGAGAPPEGRDPGRPDGRPRCLSRPSPVVGGQLSRQHIPHIMARGTATRAVPPCITPARAELRLAAAPPPAAAEVAADDGDTVWARLDEIGQVYLPPLTTALLTSSWLDHERPAAAAEMVEPSASTPPRAANADDAPGTQPFCSLEEPGDAGAVEEGRRTT